MRGSLILYLKGMRIVMFQLSGFYYSRIIFEGALTSRALHCSRRAATKGSVGRACHICNNGGWMGFRYGN